MTLQSIQGVFTVETYGQPVTSVPPFALNRKPVLQAVAAGLVGALVVIVVVFLASGTTERHAGAIGLVKKATARGIRHYRAEAESAGGALSVT